MQGDVLKRTENLDELLKTVHPHFFNNNENTHFIVLTQSCDLVIRGSSGCKSPYIVIAPVRSLDLVVDRFVTQAQSVKISAELPVLSMKTNSKIREFLTRLFNNNETNYFYLNSDGTDLNQDSVAFLNLSIAIKADKHMQKCLDAKILQLNDTFQAKLGWLVGQLYSRVGTQDWEPADVKRKIDEMLPEIAIWIEDGKLKAIESKFAEAQRLNESERWTAEFTEKMAREIPSQKQNVIRQATVVSTQVFQDAKKTVESQLRYRLDTDGELLRLMSDDVEPRRSAGGEDQPEGDARDDAAAAVRKARFKEITDDIIGTVLQEAFGDIEGRLQRRLNDDQALTRICKT
jgi:hypothetical protein